MRLTEFVVHNFPAIGCCKRFAKAVFDTLMPSRSYSQHGEDQFVWEYLSRKDLLKGIYVDVGANHPTSISNTYLFYRRGFSGITIEPNHELARLHRIFRNKDRVLEIGADNKSGLFELNISKTPVLSSFKDLSGSLLWKKQLVPVLKLDDVVKHIDPERIFFLNIDTEGLNLEVVQGAGLALERTLILCLEVDNEDEEEAVMHHLAIKHSFSRIRKMGCNILFLNNSMCTL